MAKRKSEGNNLQQLLRKERSKYKALRRFSNLLQEQRMLDYHKEQHRLMQLGPEVAAQEIGRHCEYCGALLIPRFETFEVIGKNRSMMLWPECHCPEAQAHVEKVQHEIEEAKKKAKMDAYEYLLDKTGLIGWLGQATFENYLKRVDFEDSVKCKAQVVEYANSFLNGESGDQWLILYGDYGTGKSHLAAAVIRAAIDNGQQHVYFRIWPEYLERLKATFDRQNECEETQAQITAELRNGNLVVIDDLDKSLPTDWMRGVLYTVLNYRYNEQLPTILTFNYGPLDVSSKAPGRLALEEYLGRAIIDRILERATLVEFSGPSYRSGIEW